MFLQFMTFLLKYKNDKLSEIFSVKCQSFSPTSSTELLSVGVQSQWENFVTVVLITSDALLIIRLYFFWLPGLHIWSSEPQAVTLLSVGKILFISMTLSLIFPQQGGKYSKLYFKGDHTDVSAVSPAECKKVLCVCLHINKTSVSICLVSYIGLKHLNAWPVIVMTPQVTSLRGAHKGVTWHSWADSDRLLLPGINCERDTLTN